MMNLKSILWSYDLSKIDLDKDKKTVIINTVNYGDWEQWRWLADYYGLEEVRAVLESVPVTEIRGHVRRLAALIFKIDHFNNAPRGAR